MHPNPPAPTTHGVGKLGSDVGDVNSMPAQCLRGVLGGSGTFVEGLTFLVDLQNCEHVFLIAFKFETPFTWYIVSLSLARDVTPVLTPERRASGGNMYGTDRCAVSLNGVFRHWT
jgi:hypothetical protein